MAVTPLGCRPLSAWRAWTLWPQWKSTNLTAMSSVPNTRPTEPSLTRWRAWICQCRPPQPHCLYSHRATRLPTPPQLPHRLLNCWRTGNSPGKCPGSDGFTLKKWQDYQSVPSFHPSPRMRSSLLLLTTKNLMCPYIQILHKKTHTHTLEDIPRNRRIGIISIVNPPFFLNDHISKWV